MAGAKHDVSNLINSSRTVLGNIAKINNAIGLAGGEPGITATLFHDLNREVSRLNDHAAHVANMAMASVQGDLAKFEKVMDGLMSSVRSFKNSEWAAIAGTTETNLIRAVKKSMGSSLAKAKSEIGAMSLAGNDPKLKTLIQSGSPTVRAAAMVRGGLAGGNVSGAKSAMSVFFTEAVRRHGRDVSKAMAELRTVIGMEVPDAMKAQFEADAVRQSEFVQTIVDQGKKQLSADLRRLSQSGYAQTQLPKMGASFSGAAKSMRETLGEAAQFVPVESIMSEVSAGAIKHLIQRTHGPRIRRSKSRETMGRRSDFSYLESLKDSVSGLAPEFKDVFKGQLDSLLKDAKPKRLTGADNSKIRASVGAYIREQVRTNYPEAADILEYDDDQIAEMVKGMHETEYVGENTTLHIARTIKSMFGSPTPARRRKLQESDQNMVEGFDSGANSLRAENPEMTMMENDEIFDVLVNDLPEAPPKWHSTEFLNKVLRYVSKHPGASPEDTSFDFGASESSTPASAPPEPPQPSTPDDSVYGMQPPPPRKPPTAQGGLFPEDDGGDSGEPEDPETYGFRTGPASQQQIDYEEPHVRLPRALRKMLLTQERQLRNVKSRVEQLLENGSITDSMGSEMIAQQMDVLIGSAGETTRSTLMTMGRREPLNTSKLKDWRDEMIRQIDFMGVTGSDLNEVSREVDKSIAQSLVASKANEYMAGKKDKALLLRTGNRLQDTVKEITNAAIEDMKVVGIADDQIRASVDLMQHEAENRLRRASSAELAKFSEDFGASSLGFEYTRQVEGRGLYGQEAFQAAEKLTQERLARVTELLPEVAPGVYLETLKKDLGVNPAMASMLEQIEKQNPRDALETWRYTDQLGQTHLHEGDEGSLNMFLKGLGVKFDKNGKPIMERGIRGRASLESLGAIPGKSEAQVGYQMIQSAEATAASMRASIAADKAIVAAASPGVMSDEEHAKKARHAEKAKQRLDELWAQADMGLGNKDAAQRYEALLRRLEESIALHEQSEKQVAEAQARLATTENDLQKIEAGIVTSRETELRQEKSSNARRNIAKEAATYGVTTGTRESQELMDQETFRRVTQSMTGVDESVYARAKSFERVAKTRRGVEREIKQELDALKKKEHLTDEEYNRRQELSLRAKQVAAEAASAERAAREIPVLASEVAQLNEQRHTAKTKAGRARATSKYDQKKRDLQLLLEGGQTIGGGAKGWNYAAPMLAYGFEDFFQVLAMGQGPMRGFLAAANNIGPALGMLMGSATGASVAVAGMLAVSALVQSRQEKDKDRYKALAENVDRYSGSLKELEKVQNSLSGKRAGFAAGSITGGDEVQALSGYMQRVDNLIRLMGRSTRLADRTHLPAGVAGRMTHPDFLSDWMGAGITAVSDIFEGAFVDPFRSPKNRVNEFGEDEYMQGMRPDTMAELEGKHGKGSPKFGTRTLQWGAAGATTGAALGLVGGPFAPATMTAGALLGGSIGAVIGVFHDAIEQGMVRDGSSYDSAAIKAQIEHETKRFEELSKQGGFWDIYKKTIRSLGDQAKQAQELSNYYAKMPGMADRALGFSLGIGRELGDTETLKSASAGISKFRVDSRRQLLMAEETAKETRERLLYNPDEKNRGAFKLRPIGSGENMQLGKLRKFLAVATGNTQGMKEDEIARIRASSEFDDWRQSTASGRENEKDDKIAAVRLGQKVKELEAEEKLAREAINKADEAAEIAKKGVEAADKTWRMALTKKGAAASQAFSEMSWLDQNGVFSREMRAQEVAGKTRQYADKDVIANFPKEDARLLVYAQALAAMGELGETAAKMDDMVFKFTKEFDSARGIIEREIGQGGFSRLKMLGAANAAFSITGMAGLDAKPTDFKLAEQDNLYAIAMQKRSEILNGLTLAERQALAPLMDRQLLLAQAEMQEKKMTAIMNDPLMKMAAGYNQFAGIAVRLSSDMATSAARAQASGGAFTEAQAQFFVIADAMKQMGMETKSFTQGLIEYRDAAKQVDNAIAGSSLNNLQKAFLRSNLADQVSFMDYQRASSDPTTQAITAGRSGYNEREVYGGRSGVAMNLTGFGANLQAQYEAQRRKVKAQFGDNPGYSQKKQEALDALNSRQNMDLANQIYSQYNLAEPGYVKMSDAESVYKSIQESLSFDPALQVQMEERDIMRDIYQVLKDGLVSQQEFQSLSPAAQARMQELYQDDPQALLNAVANQQGIMGQGIGQANPGGAMMGLGILSNGLQSAASTMMQNAQGWFANLLGPAGAIAGAAPVPGTALAGGPGADAQRGIANAGDQLLQQQIVHLGRIEGFSEKSYLVLSELQKTGIKVSTVLT